MSDKTEPSAEVPSDGRATARSRYQPPRLVDYGSVSALTAGGSGPTVEAATGRACGMGNIFMRVNPSCP